MKVYASTLSVIFWVASSFATNSGLVQASGMIQYNRDIRPILSENCFACHGPDAAKRAAELRLDQRDVAVSKSAIVAGKPDESELVRRILSSDPTTLMPPADSHKALTNQQKELLKAWIAEGAEYQGHWSFIPPVKPELPQVRNAAWIRNPIDRFVLAELERRGLEPSPEAETRSLVRRVCFDLTGLPPSPEEVERVIADPSPERYENYVDELLKRPEWGEHRGRYWLDYARYADTHGIHFDNFREMWSYREWVINAFNRNLPFDQFTVEQLAGDLLPNADLDQRIATGFNRCNITTNEGGAIDEEYKVLYTRDRVETTGQVWLGLTVGCAVCHDHKFDPITQSDFYSMAAFFNNTTQAAMDGNIKDTPPIIPVPRNEDRARFLELSPLIDQANAAVAARRAAARPPFDELIGKTEEREKLAWQSLPANEALETHIPLASSDLKWISATHQGQTRQIALTKDATLVPGHVSDLAWQVTDHFPSLPVGDLERDQPFSIALWVKPSSDAQNGALVARMDEATDFRGWDIWAENGLVGMHLIHKVVSTTKLTAARWQHVTVTYDGSSNPDGIKILIDGKESGKTVQAKTLTESTKTTVPFNIGRRSAGSVAANAQIQDIRIYRKALSAEEATQIAGVTRRQYVIAKATRTPEETEELYSWYLNARDNEYIQLNTQAQTLVAEKAQLLQRGTIAHVMNEANSPAKAFVLTRGDYDKRGTEVPAATPKVLPPMQPDLPPNRLGFAKWLLQPEHPLTARVTANRFWQELFGTGLVGSSGDFGATGQMPSHPELLDYLATSLRDDGWNVKNYFRLIVTSATYRQSASVSQEKLALDPANKWLSRGPRFRMDAEMIRDSALATSGLLVPKIGGPSVRPYQPAGVWEAVAMPGSNTRDYVPDKGEGLYRRSMYTFLKRAAPPPNMDVFNATAREVCTVKRERTNTPLQALVTLNDVQFVEAARVLASKTLLDTNLGTDINARIQSIAKKLVARPLRAEELGVVTASLNELIAYYQSAPEQAKELIAVGESKADPSLNVHELAAWTMLVNELMNLDEMLTK
jgi:mono/diheme cytochrome c family protein